MNQPQIEHGWEAMAGDSMPWLLDPSRPNLHWRVLIDLLRRPPQSRAVEHARGGSNAVDPIATLLEDLQPDGSWVGEHETWEMASGPGWRLVAAVQWGADASDPRLHAASQLLLEEAPGEGGFAVKQNEEPVPWLTARALQALSGLGWWHHPRFQEALAWLEEAAPRSEDGGWLGSNPGTAEAVCRVTPVALLDVLSAGGGANRVDLTERAVGSLRSVVASADEGMYVLGHPNFDRTDAAEAFAVLARTGAEWDPVMRPSLQRLQELQIEGGRWARGVEVPSSLPIGERPAIGDPSRWITLHAATAVLGYAVEAGLPRMFPQKPS